MHALRAFIKDSWDKTIAERTKGEFTLPYPFVPPTVQNGDFCVLFYWDTYFTNVGLLADGKTQLALYNVENLLYALDYFGCVPNYTREKGAQWCSQPPLLCLMVQDIFKVTKDEEWLARAVVGLEKEYEFWMTKRMTPIGLNQYGCNETDEQELVGYYQYVSGRIPLPQDISNSAKAEKAKHFVAEAESGLDFSPRYADHNALDYVQLDLNSHLYGVEKFLCEYFKDKDAKKHTYYQRQGNTRLQLMEQYCYDETRGVYCDYDFVAQKKSELYFAGCFLPYFYGFAKKDSNLSVVYDSVKCKGGIYTCCDTGDRSYQWGYPNIWAPDQFFAYEGLRRYGYMQEAEALRVGYVQLLSETYEKTGCLWERYHENGAAPSLEYKTVIMLGWTAGVYTYFYEIGNQ